MYKHITLIETRPEICAICSKPMNKLEEVEVHLQCKHVLHSTCLENCVDTNAPKFVFNGCYVCQKIHDLPPVPETLKSHLPELTDTLKQVDKNKLAKVKQSDANNLSEEDMLNLLIETLGEEKAKMMLEKIMSELK